jgi:hypothetical protein
MKNITLFVLMFFTINAYSQKKKHGTIYVDHPAINTVLSMQKASKDGDYEKAYSYLADDFIEIYGLSSNKNQKGRTKEAYKKEGKWLQKNMSYFNLTPVQDTYLIALEFKNGDNKDVVHVQWSKHMKGVYNKTGVKVDTPIDYLYVVNKENKIEKIIFNMDKAQVNEHFDSYEETKAGTIYNHHEYINKVRRLVHAFEFNDAETTNSFYSKKALFRDINMPAGKELTIEEMMEKNRKFHELFSINSIDIVFSPSYYVNESLNNKLVQSLWRVSLTRKSDSKKIVLPLRLFHFFYDDGLIAYTEIIYSAKLLED